MQRPKLANSYQFGIIPKHPIPKQMEIYLSTPNGHSVNDGILEQLCYLKNPNVHDGAKMTSTLGKGELLEKLDW